MQIKLQLVKVRLKMKGKYWHTYQPKIIDVHTIIWYFASLFSFGK